MSFKSTYFDAEACTRTLAAFRSGLLLEYDDLQGSESQTELEPSYSFWSTPTWLMRCASVYGGDRYFVAPANIVNRFAGKGFQRRISEVERSRLGDLATDYFVVGELVTAELIDAGSATAPPSEAARLLPQIEFIKSVASTPIERSRRAVALLESWLAEESDSSAETSNLAKLMHELDDERRGRRKLFDGS